MPVNRLIAHRDFHELRVQSSGSGNHTGLGTGVYTHGATGVTWFVVDIVDRLDGIFVTVDGNSATDTWTVTYTGPGFPFGTSWSGSGWANVEAKVIFEDLKLYSREIQLMKLTGTIKIYVQGVLEATIPFEGDMAALGVSYVPVIALPIMIAGGCSASTTGLPGSPPDVYAYMSECTGTHTGGYRWQEAGSGAWSTNPVLPCPGAAPAVPGGCVDPGVAQVEATNTYDLEIESYSKGAFERSVFQTGEITACTERIYCNGVLVWEETVTQDPPVPWTIWENKSESWSRSGTIQAVPNLPKRFRRFNADYGALWDRWQFPQTTIREYSSCSINGVSSTAGGLRTVHPAQSVIRQKVGASTAAMEDTLGYPSYAPWSTAGSYSRSKTYDYSVTAVACPGVPEPSGLCPEPGVVTYEGVIVGGPTLIPTESMESTRGVIFPNNVGATVPPGTFHSDPMVRYWASWCNPHWGYGYKPSTYDVLGAEATWADYGSRIGQQYLDDAILPAHERTRQRNTIVSCPLYLSSYQPWLDEYRAGVPWLGISRWDTDAVELEDFIDLDATSADRWDSPDATATLTFGADIVINPSASTCKVRFKLTDFEAFPFMFPALCDRVKLDWELANVDEVRAYLVSISGERAILEQNNGDGFTTDNVTYPLPQAVDVEYAGSHGQEFGAMVVANAGSDTLPEGRSALAMADPQQVHDFQLLGGRQGQYIEFEFDVDDTGVDVTLKYPRFYTSESQRQQFQETRQAIALLWPNGPGVRWGQWLWYVPVLGLQNPPLIERPGYTSTIIDWLCARRVQFQAMAHDDGLTTELTTRFDSFEGQAVGQVDKHSMAFILPI